jgi:hypothetical protein
MGGVGLFTSSPVSTQAMVCGSLSVPIFALPIISFTSEELYGLYLGECEPSNICTFINVFHLGVT